MYLITRVDRHCNLISGYAHGFAYILNPWYLGQGMEYPLLICVEEQLYNYSFNKPTEYKEALFAEYNNFRIICLEQKKANKWFFQ